MKVAVVPLQYSRGFRALNLTRLQRAIVRTAELEPAPDLIVLPAWPEGWFTASQPTLFTPAMCEGHVAALSHLAREWGIWIAAGCTSPAGLRGDLGAALVDPDGDVWTRVLEGNGKAAGGHNPASAGWYIEATPLARIAFVAGSQLDRVLASLPADAALPDLVLLLATIDQVRNARERLAQLARSASAWLCMSAAGVSDAGPRTSDAFGLILDPHGAIVAEHPYGKPTTLVAELPIVPPPISAAWSLPDTSGSSS